MRYGRYEVVTEIGRGSMGVVYKAHDPQIDRRVALKVLREDRLSSEDYVKRFLKEATAVGRLSHRSIVTVYDIGQDHGTIYIAMELLEGIPLDELLKQQDIGLEKITNIGREVSEALHYAHQKGIVHRDIKPANIICSDNGDIKVTDFGIAHIEDPDGQQMTQAGEILGTPVYMSPEQVLGQPVDGRSDIYSLGVILYELTTGRRPFHGENIGALFNAITNDPVVPPARVKPGIPEWLSLTIMKALAREPAQRYSSGESLSMDIGKGGKGGDAQQGYGKSKSKKTWIVAVVLLLVFSVAGVLYFSGYYQMVAGFFHQDEEQTVTDGQLEKQAEEERKEVSAPESPSSVKLSAPDARRPLDNIQIKEKAVEPVGKNISTSELKPPEAAVRAPETGADSRGALPPDEDMGIFSNPAFEPEELSSPAVKTGLNQRVPADQSDDNLIFKTDSKDNVSDRQAVPAVPDRKEAAVIAGKTVNNRKTDKVVPAVKAKSSEQIDVKQETTLGKNKPIVAASLEPVKKIESLAVLTMQTNPQGARVYVDGEYKGKTPSDIKVSADKHEVMIQLEGHGDWKAQLDLRKGGEIPLSIRLLPK